MDKDPSLNAESKQPNESYEQWKGLENYQSVTPGSSSEANGANTETGFAESGITAPGSSISEGRLSGGSNQAVTEAGESKTADENAYHSNDSIEQGKKIDDAGNNAVVPDKVLDDAAKERAVAEENF